MDRFKTVQHRLEFMAQVYANVATVVIMRDRTAASGNQGCLVHADRAASYVMQFAPGHAGSLVLLTAGVRMQWSRYDWGAIIVCIVRGSDRRNPRCGLGDFSVLTAGTCRRFTR